MTTSRPAQVAVIGSGGHAKVVIEAMRAAGDLTIVGCTDAKPSASHVLGVPVLGTDEELARLYDGGLRQAFVALGDNRLRLKVGRALMARGFEFPSVIHPSATISPSAHIGRGVVVMAGAVLNASAVIGDFCIVNTLAAIDHDCVLGDGVHVAPRTALAGGVTLESGVFMGIGATAIPGVTVGAHSIVGAGGVVVHDLPAGITAVGIPARARP